MEWRYHPIAAAGSGYKIMQKNMYGYLFLGTLIVMIDRISKSAALTWCAQSAHTITSFLSCDLFFNRGISWGFLHSDSDYLFVGVSLVQMAITIVISWCAYQRYVRGGAIIGEICIVAGSFSNLIDRAVYSGVIDFIILSYNNISWPVFNIADVAIVCGVGILIFQHEE